MASCTRCAAHMQRVAVTGLCGKCYATYRAEQAALHNRCDCGMPRDKDAKRCATCHKAWLIKCYQQRRTCPGCAGTKRIEAQRCKRCEQAEDANTVRDMEPPATCGCGNGDMATPWHCACGRWKPSTCDYCEVCQPELPALSIPA